MSIVCLSIGIGFIAYYLSKKQVKYVKTLKVGDKVLFYGKESEILEIITDTEIVIKTTVSGMLLNPYKPKQTKRYGRKI